MRVLLVLGVLGALLLASVSAEAQQGLSRHTVTLTRRPIIDPPVTFRFDLGPPDRAMLDSGVLGEGYGLRIIDTRGDDDVLVTFGAGVAFSLAERFELGAKLLPLRLSDDADYLDMEIYARIGLIQSRHVLVALQFIVQIPTHDDFGTSFGVPVAIRFHPRVRLDLGVEIELVLEDDDGDPDDDDELEVHLDAPAALTFNVTDRFFFGGRFGITFYRFDDLEAPLGGFIGYTLGNRNRYDLSFSATAFLGDDAVARRWELVWGLVGRIPVGR